MSTLSQPRYQIAICGNGASAALLVHALARRVERPTTVCAIGAGEYFGEGIAYSTRNPQHLLNVTAPRMSADPDVPGQFHAWLAENGTLPAAWAETFQSRTQYGQYLRKQVASAICANPNLALALERSDIRGIVRRDNGWTVSYRNGAVDADIVVLATGNDMPERLSSRYGGDIAAAIVDNPWGALKLARGEDVLILGTALTAVDTVLSLVGQGHKGKITLLSRRGLVPHTHVQPEPGPVLPQHYARSVAEILRATRELLGRKPSPAQWQGFMDAMRPHWSDIWQNLPVREQRRFLRHGATIWNAHRHRLAPAVGAQMEQILGTRAQILRGRIAGLSPNPDGSLAVKISGRDGQRIIDADRIINCTGPNSDPEKTNDPFIENLIASRYARASSSGIGLDVDARDRLIARNGEVHHSFFAMGSLTRGKWWEITAIPEIAHQAQRLAQTLAEQLEILKSAPKPAYRAPREGDEAFLAQAP